MLISADSHVIEPDDLWVRKLSARFQANAPKYPSHPFKHQDGGVDPAKRVAEMATDGVSAEVLYPSLNMDQFGIKDPALQESCFRIYNDWLADFCIHDSKRMFGISPVSLYNIDTAVKEAHRYKKLGMRGLMIWQVPPDELSFATKHYEKFWAAAEELEMPVSMHVNTGAPYAVGSADKWGRDLVQRLTKLVSIKSLHVQNTLIQIICSGVLARFPGLKIVLVENEMSWLPFFLWQLDRYYSRTGEFDNPGMTMLPSEYFQRQIYATFFNDPPSKFILGNWGTDNCMWSNDFPHKNSTWPNSRSVLSRDLGALSDATRAKLVFENVKKLYKLPDITPIQ